MTCPLLQCCCWPRGLECLLRLQVSGTLLCCKDYALILWQEESVLEWRPLRSVQLLLVLQCSLLLPAGVLTQLLLRIHCLDHDVVLENGQLQKT